MTSPWTVGRPRIFVGDNCALLNEVIGTARRGYLTSFLAALRNGSALLFIPRHVYDELRRHLSEQAAARVSPVEAEVAWRWWMEYAQFTRVVDVPEEWGADVQAVESVAQRHGNDVPFARLLVALSPCIPLTEDPDLIDNGFGIYDRLPVLHAAANEAEVKILDQATSFAYIFSELFVAGAYHGLRRLPPLVQVGVVSAVTALAVKAYRDGTLIIGTRKVGRALVKAADAVMPIMNEIAERHQAGLQAWDEHVLSFDGWAPLSEQIARILAFAPPSGLLASDIARELTDDSGNLKDRTTAVRRELAAAPAFVQITRGRWCLGHAVAPCGLTPAGYLEIEWIARSHAKALPPVERSIELPLPTGEAS